VLYSIVALKTEELEAIQNLERRLGKPVLALKQLSIEFDDLTGNHRRQVVARLLPRTVNSSQAGFPGLLHRGGMFVGRDGGADSGVVAGAVHWSVLIHDVDGGFG